MTFVLKTIYMLSCDRFLEFVLAIPLYRRDLYLMILECSDIIVDY